MCPVLCRVDDGCWAFFDGFAARFDAAVRPPFVASFPDIVKLVRAPQQQRQAPNLAAKKRETEHGRLSPSSKQRVAMEIAEHAGCHGI